jgi:hypothetical protein
MRIKQKLILTLAILLSAAVIGFIALALGLSHTTANLIGLAVLAVLAALGTPFAFGARKKSQGFKVVKTNKPTVCAEDGLDGIDATPHRAAKHRYGGVFSEDEVVVTANRAGDWHTTSVHRVHKATELSGTQIIPSGGHRS